MLTLRSLCLISSKQTMSSISRSISCFTGLKVIVAQDKAPKCGCRLLRLPVVAMLCVGRVSHNAYIFLDNQQHSSLLVSVCVDRVFGLYEGRSINKLQNGAIPLNLKIGKIRNIRFVRNLILKIHRKFFDDDVTPSVHTTQSICVLFSPPVFCHNSQVINSI